MLHFDRSCSNNTEMDGRKEVICEAGGNWSSTPECVRICVNAPPDIANGGYVATGNRINDTARYSCDTGYQIEENEPNGLFMRLRLF
jgi:hypothetical protein